MVISPLVIGVYALTSFIGALAIPMGTPAQLVLAALLATAVAAGGTAIAAPLAKRTSTVLISAVIIGLVRGLSLLACAVWFGAPIDSLTLVSSVISAVIWIGGTALIVGNHRRYEARFANLVRAAAALRAPETLSQLDEVAAVQDSIAKAAANADPNDAAALRAASLVIRQQIDESLRPLSHRIWFDARRAAPRVRIGRLVLDAAMLLPVPVWTTIGVWCASSFVGAIHMYGAERGIISLLLTAIVLAAMLPPATRLARRYPRWWLGPLILVACAVLPVLVASIVVTQANFSTTQIPEAITFIFVPIALGSLMLVTASIALSFTDQEEVLAGIASRAAATAGDANSAVSAYLHNSLQSELTGLAMQLENAAPGSPEAQIAIERMAALANRSIADEFRDLQLGPRERLARVSQAWAGIADIGISIDPDIDNDEPQLSVVVQIAEELIANAVRHAGATWVEVTVAPGDTCLVVEARSNGQRAAVRGQGMGTDWLNSVCRDSVTLERVDDVLVARALL